MRSRRGFTVVEVVVALMVGLITLGLSLRAFSSALRAQGRVTQAAERIAALRVARFTLRGELRSGVAARDWRVFAPDSLTARAFQGAGYLCPTPEPDGSMRVSWAGRRAPDPSRDSVLLLAPSGQWSVVRLVGVGVSSACPEAPTQSVSAWTTQPPAAPGTVAALLFTSGSYHWSGRALRYRRGRAGRQPLTPEVLNTPPSGFGSGPASVGWTLNGGTAWRWTGYLAEDTTGGN